jgi:hypothetical protein
LRADFLGRTSNAEVDELHHPAGRYHHIGRRYVAVNDQICMSEGNSGTGVQQLVDAFAARGVGALRPVDDRLALDVFHDDVGRAVVRFATIKQLRDVGMVQLSENLTLAQKALDHAL